MPTFAQRVDGALAVARADTPFTLSRAQEEEALAPVIDHLLTLPDAPDYIRASHRGAGSYDVLAVSLFKAARLEQAWAAERETRSAAEAARIKLDKAQARARVATAAWMDARRTWTEACVRLDRLDPSPAVKET